MRSRRVCVRFVSNLTKHSSQYQFSCYVCSISWLFLHSRDDDTPYSSPVTKRMEFPRRCISMGIWNREKIIMTTAQSFAPDMKQTNLRLSNQDKHLYYDVSQATQ